MRDFTLTIYKKLLLELFKAGYGFVTFVEFMKKRSEKEKLIILRHDVDKKPSRSLRSAELEKELGIKGTYYFRVIKNKLPGDVIERIAKLGHEIGYHYDDLNTAGGSTAKALECFQKNLARLREIAPVETACMHGSPLSRFDNRELWENKNYREFGITGEPYFDIDFSEVLYLTDTGRRWDGERVSIRDRVSGDGRWARGERGETEQRTEDRGQKSEDREEKECRGAVNPLKGTYFHNEFNQPSELLKSSFESIPSLDVFSGYPELVKNIAMVDQSDPPECADDWCCAPPALRLHSTANILLALKKDLLPDKIMLTVHPQRWIDNWFFWIKELLWQKFKNLIKYLKIKRMEKTK